MNASEVARVAYQAGFRGRGLRTAVAVALAESGGDPRINARGAEDSRGLWQINEWHFRRYDEKRLYEPLYNARAAYDISDGGRDWQPWTTWREGLHEQYLDDARRAVRSRPWRTSDPSSGDDAGDGEGDGHGRHDHGGRGGADGDRRGGGAGRGRGSEGDSGGTGQGDRGRRSDGGREGADGRGTGRGNGGRRRRAELAPWRIPPGGVGRTGRLVVTPSFLDELARTLTGHLATADEVDRGARRTVAELDVDRLVVADGLDGFVTRTARAAVEDHDGTRRLPGLLTCDVGYVVEAHRRAVDMDASKAFGRRAVDALVASLGPGASSRTRRRVRRLLGQLGPDRLPTTPRPGPRQGRRHDRHGHPDHVPGDGHGHDGRRPRRGGTDPDDVRLDRRWGGTQAVFEQLVTPFLRRRGLQPGSAKRGVIPGSSTGSDHYTGNATAYAVDYPTTTGEDDARALARRLGIEGWRPDSYQRFHVRIGGARFRAQILWGAGIDHGDHVHVGLRRA